MNTLPLPSTGETRYAGVPAWVAYQRALAAHRAASQVVVARAVAAALALVVVLLLLGRPLLALLAALAVWLLASWKVASTQPRRDTVRLLNELVQRELEDLEPAAAPPRGVVIRGPWPARPTRR
jgi:hypothetical protein